MDVRIWAQLAAWSVILLTLSSVSAGPLGNCPESNQSERLNDRCRLRRFVAPRDQNALLQCSSATSFEIKDALNRYAYRRCSFVLFLDILSVLGNDTLDLAEDTFEAIPTVTTHLQLWGLTWIIPSNWNELTPFALTNTIKQLHIVNMKLVAPENTLPFDLFKGLDKVERIAIFHTEMPLIEDGFFDVFPKLTCLKLYNISVPCTCGMKWFHDYIIRNQFTMIFNGDMDCGVYNTNCYGNGLDGVWIFSPDVDTTLNACTASAKLSSKALTLNIPGISSTTLSEVFSNATDSNDIDSAAKMVFQAERRSDVQQLDPISLDCQPDGFRILIPLHTSPVTKAEFWNYGNVSRCTSSGNVETSQRMLVLAANYSSCGTILTEDEESLIFQNVVVVQHPEVANEDTNSVIERVDFSMIPVICTFTRSDRFSFLQTSDLQPAAIRRMKDPLSGTNNAKVRIEIVNAVASALSNTFSFDIFAEAILDARVSLMVETLYATPTNNSVDSTRYDIVIAGCSKDVTLKSVPLAGKRVGFRFNISPFKFRGNVTNDVYLHGHALLCNNFNEKCEFKCPGRPEEPVAVPSLRSLDDEFDIVRYSRDSVLRAVDII